MVTLADAYLFLAEMAEMKFAQATQFAKDNLQLYEDVFAVEVCHRMESLEHSLMSKKEFDTFWDEKSYINWLIFLTSYCEHEGI